MIDKKIIVPQNIVVNTDITHIKEYGKSIVGLCIRSNENSENALYITYSIVKSLDTVSMECFAIFWAMQVIHNYQKKSMINNNLNIDFLCDNNNVVTVINSNKNKKINTNILSNLYNYLNILRETNKIKVRWIDRSNNTLIDRYIAQKKAIYLSTININQNKEIEMFNNNSLERLIKRTLNNLAEILPEIIRFNHLKKIASSAQGNICINHENKIFNIYFNILSYHMSLYTSLNDNAVSKNYITFINNIFEILEEYNAKVDCINSQLTENSIKECN